MYPILIYLIAASALFGSPALFFVELFLVIKLRWYKNLWWKLGSLMGLALALFVWSESLRYWNLEAVFSWREQGLLLYFVLFSSVLLLGISFICFSYSYRKRKWVYIPVGIFLLFLALSYFFYVFLATTAG